MLAGVYREPRNAPTGRARVRSPEQVTFQAFASRATGRGRTRRELRAAVDAADLGRRVGILPDVHPEGEGGDEQADEVGPASAARKIAPLAIQMSKETSSESWTLLLMPHSTALSVRSTTASSAAAMHLSSW
jgi:hypothetical protein